MTTNATQIEQSSMRAWARALYPPVVLLLLGLLLYAARDGLGPYLLGFLMAYLLIPVVRAVERVIPLRGRLARYRRPIAAISTSILALLLLVLLVGVVLKPVIEQTGELFGNLDHYWDEIRAEHGGFRAWYEEDVPEEVQVRIDSTIARLGDAIVAGITGIGKWLLSGTDSVINAVAALFAIPLFVIYYLLEEGRTSSVLRRQMPGPWSEDVIAVFRLVDRVLGSYTRGVVVESVIVGVLTGVGYWLIGVEMALALGVVALAGEIVPILGPWIAFFLSFPVVLVTQPDRAIAAVGLFAVIQVLEGWLIAPRAGESVDFTSAGTLLILAIGGALGGGFGVVFALPAASILRATIVYIAHRLEGDAPEAALGKLRVFQRPASTHEPALEASRT